MLTNKNWETPYYAHIGDKDKLGNMWSANLHYLNIPIHIGYMMPVSKKISLFMNAGPYWGVGLFGKYTMTSGDKDTTIAENIFKDYLKRFDCGIESQKIYCGQTYIMVTTGSRMFKRTCGKNRRRSCENPCVERKKCVGNGL